MTEWIDVVAVEFLADGEHVLAEVQGEEVAVFNIGQQFYAIENVCTHDGAEIASGELIGDELVCPRHGARFCVKTGEVKCPPAYENLRSFQVRVMDGKIQVAETI